MFNHVTWPAKFDPKTSAIYALNDIDVDAPPEVVWELLVDAENWWRYFPSETNVHIDGGGRELTLGTRFSRVAEQYPMSLVVTECDRFGRLSWSTTVDGDRSGSTAYHGWVITLFLAVPYWSHRDVAKTLDDWSGKTLIDVTNAYGATDEQLGGLPSSVVVARAFDGAALVKAFNHLPGKILSQDPDVKGGRRVIFTSSDNDEAAKSVAELISNLGFAPVSLGRLAEGGTLTQARGTSWSPLTFQDLVKFA